MRAKPASKEKSVDLKVRVVVNQRTSASGVISGEDNARVRLSIRVFVISNSSLKLFHPSFNDVSTPNETNQRRRVLPLYPCWCTGFTATP